MSSPPEAPPTSPPSLSERLQTVTEALAAARTGDDVFRVILTPALQALDAVAGAILLVNQTGDRLEIAATQGHEEDAKTLWQDGPLDGNVPAGDALERHEALFFEHQGDLIRAYPELEARTGGVAAVATAVLPMFLEAHPLGVLILDFREPHHFTPEEIRFLRTLAAPCALALGRVQATQRLEAQVRARTAELEAILESIPDAVYVGGAQGITRANPRALEMLGFDNVEDLNRHIEVLAEQLQNRHPSTLERVKPQEEAFAIALGGTPHTYDVLTRHLQTGADRLIRSAAAPIRVDGQVVGAVAVNSDITESNQVQDLRALNAELEARVEARTRELEGNNRELEARTLALERFAELARRQESDPLTLIRQAQEAVSELIGEGFAVYYELGGNAWRLKAQVGSPGDETIQASLESALPYETVRNFRLPWESGQPFYQDAYDPALDHGVPGTEALASTAALPLFVGTRRRGMFGYGLTVSRAWTRADRATLETAVTSLGLALERAEQTRALEEERAALDAFVAFSEAAGTGTDVLALAGEALAVLGARFPECSRGYSELDGELWKLRVHSADLYDHPELLRQGLAGLPRDTPIFARTLETGAPVFVDAWDAAQGQIERTEVYGTLATYPLVYQGETRGVLTIGLKTQTRWTERDRAVVRAVGRSLNLALERAEQARQLQARRDEEARRSQALAAYAELSRDLVLETDPLVLIRRTQEIVLALLPPGFSGYFEPQEGLWRLRSQVGHPNTPELQAALDAGLPCEATTNLMTPWRSGEPYYQDEYDPDLDDLPDSDEYPGASVTIPIVVGGETHGVLAFALYTVRHWSGEDRAVLETVGRQLTLALEQTEQTRRLAVQNEELEARTRALSAFVELTRDLSFQSEPDALIGRALENVMTLLPPGFALFYQKSGDRWHATAQVGSLGTPELQATVEAGLPVGHTPTLDLPDQTREPLFQDVYDPARDVAAELVSHLSTVATLPVLVGREVLGIFNVGLFGQRRWSVAERAVLETTARSLGLALEGAQSVAELAQRTRELERSNAELEQFAYIASHDLQAPIRAVTSFAGVIDRRYGPQLDERGRLYLRQIVESGEHMKRLVDDLLAFSRVHTERRALLPTDAEAVFEAVANRLQSPGAIITRGDLPVVQADPQQLDQLLQNLISNGLKYRREGVSPQMQVTAERDGEVWRFAVSDNGIGIEAEYFERIFVIFQRLHGRETYEGTGIGLAVCKKIVERHGGRLWLESTPGEGSTFFFTLPEA